MNRDKLNHVSPEAVSIAALDVLDRLDRGDTEVQVAGLAVALLAVTRRIGVDRHDLLAVANNVMNAKDASGPGFTAMRDYVNYEVAA